MWPNSIALLSFCLSCLFVRAAIVPQDQDTQDIDSANSTLELVHVLFRHGPRTPLTTYPNDPHINETYEPYSWAQLTNKAKGELYMIGKQLQRRYKGFLNSYYQPDMVLAQATESSRTIMSLQMVLAGLFPPKDTPLEWNKELNWQPIPIFYEPEATDTRLRQNVPCPRYDEAVWEVMHLPEVVALHEENSQLLRNLTEITGQNVSYAHDVTNVFISLKSEQAFGLELPPWTRDYYPNKLYPLAAQAYNYDAYTPEMRKLKGGFFLKDLYKNLHAKIAGKLEPADRKLFINCAHDWSIANVLSAFGVWKTQLPRFSALIAIELHRRNATGEYFVEIYFQNDPHKKPELLEVLGCSKQCPIEKLIELTKDNLPDAPLQQLCLAKGTSDGTRISYH